MSAEQDAYLEDDGGYTYAGGADFYPGVTTLLAEADTRLLVAVGTSVTNDLSQWDTDLTAADAGAREIPSARCNTGNTQTVEVVIDWDTGSSGVIYYHGKADGTEYALKIQIDNATGALWVGNHDDGENVITIPEPSWITGSLQQVLIVVAMEPYPDPDVFAGNFVEVHVHNLDAAADEDWERGYVNNWVADIAVDAFAVSYAGRWDGAALASDYTDTIDYVRVSSTFHTAEKAYVDWVAQDDVFAGSALQHSESLIPPSDIADVAEFAGPCMVTSQHAIARHVRRLLSPLVLVTTASPPTLEDDLTDCFSDSEGADSPQGVLTLANGWQIWRGWIWDRPIPSTCNFCHVRAHVQLWATSGSPEEIRIRAYSSTVRPEKLWMGTHSHVTGMYDANDTATGTGGWLEFGALKIHRNNAGFSLFFIATQVNNGVAHANTRAKIRAITFEPVSYETDPNVDQGYGQGGWNSP